MSLSEKLENLKATSTSKQKGNMENVAVIITNYDLENKLFEGIRIDSKEEVRVRLREDKQKRQYSRPEIEDFAADPRKSKSSTDIGGVIQFDRTYLDKDGVLNAGWATALTHSKDEGDVMVRMAKFTMSTSENDHEWAAIDVVYPERVVKTTDLEEFKETLAKMLEPQVPTDPRTVAIRIQDDDTVAFFSAYATKTEKNEEGYLVTSKGEESAEEFFKTEEFKLIEQYLENGVMLIPGRRVYAGPATRGKLFSENNVNKTARLCSQYEVKDGDENDMKNYGFVNSNIVLRQHPDKSYYFTHIGPVVDNSEPMSIQDLVA